MDGRPTKSRTFSRKLSCSGKNELMADGPRKTKLKAALAELQAIAEQ